MIYLAALLAATGYGTANFAGGIASRRQHAAMTMLISQTTALALVGVMVWVDRDQPGSLVLGAGAGLLAFAGAALAYACFALGRPIGVSAALLGMAAVAVPVVAGVGAGETPHPLGWMGLVMTLVAIAILAWPRQGSTDARAALLAIAAGGSFGAYHALMAHSAPSSGRWPILASQSVIVLLSLGFVLVARARTGARSTVALSVADGLASTLATLAALVAVRGGNLPMVGTLIALSPMVTLILARLILSEHLTTRKVVGCGLSLAAIVCLTLG